MYFIASSLSEWSRQGRTADGRKDTLDENVLPGQAESNGLGARLSPRPHPQLAEDRAHVVVDGSLGEHELRRDLGIPQTVRDEPEQTALRIGDRCGLSAVAGDGRQDLPERRSGRNDQSGIEPTRHGRYSNPPPPVRANLDTLTVDLFKC